MTAHRDDTARRQAAGTNFSRTVDELVALVHELGGALPSAGSDDPSEVRVARWLAKRRWEAKHGTLPVDRESTLDGAVPFWRETTHSLEGFEATLRACVVWRGVHGWLPRSAGGTETETRLGLWIVARRYDAHIGRLPAAHAVLLDANLDGWRETPADGGRRPRSAPKPLPQPATLAQLPASWVTHLTRDAKRKGA